MSNTNGNPLPSIEIRDLGTGTVLVLANGKKHEVACLFLYAMNENNDFLSMIVLALAEWQSDDLLRKRFILDVLGKADSGTAGVHPDRNNPTGGV